MPIGKKFGRIRPHVLPHLNARIPLFDNYLAASLKPAPAAGTWVKSWPGILGNNSTFGTCGPTGLANQIKCQSMNATGTPIIITTPQIMTFYELFGFNPALTNPVTGNNPTDQGVNLEDMLNKAMTVGIGGHLVKGFAAVTPSNVNAMRWASIVGCSLLLGWNLQQAQENQTDEGKPWAYVPGSPVVGGHCTVCYGYEENAEDGQSDWDGESWAERVSYEQGLVNHNLEECYIVLTDAGFNSDGITACGLDEAGIMSDFAWFAKNA